MRSKFSHIYWDESSATFRCRCGYLNTKDMPYARYHAVEYIRAMLRHERIENDYHTNHVHVNVGNHFNWDKKKKWYYLWLK